MLLLAHRSIRGTLIPALCRVGVGWNDVLLGPRPFSRASAEDRSSLFGWFIDSMARSDSSGACASAVWLCAFADRPRSLSGRGAPEVSRFSWMLFLGVRGFLDYAGPTARSRLSRFSRDAFLQSGESRRPRLFEIGKGQDSFR
jgi:hypothetical protein